MPKRKKSSSFAIDTVGVTTEKPLELGVSDLPSSKVMTKKEAEKTPKAKVFLSLAEVMRQQMNKIQPMVGASQAALNAYNHMSAAIDAAHEVARNESRKIRV